MRLAQVEREFLERVERHDLETRLMRRGKADAWRMAGVERLLPARRAQAPAIARLQPVEAELRQRGREVVAGGLRKRKELGVDLGADRVQPDILGAGIAAAFAVEPGQRLG